MTQHALLSASSAHRWLKCTAAPKLEQGFPDTTSEYAKEGTLAHAIAELKLRKYAIEPMGPATFTRRLNKLKKEPLYQPEMEGYTEAYLDFIKEKMLAEPVKPFVAAETRVDFGEYVPGGFGTADCLLLTKDVLHVIDFKYGKGVPVSAEDNPQMMLYALGALAKYRLLYSFKEVALHIVQPRLSNFSSFELYVDDLIKWGNDVVRPAAKEAAGDAGRFKPGEHCRFCRAKAQCKARSEYYAALKPERDAHPNAKLLTVQELGKYLAYAKELSTWAEDLKGHALSCCLDGLEVPGWKAVEGRGTRSFTDQDAAFKILIEHGTDESLLWDRVPKTLAQAEKLIGKKEFELQVGAYIVKSPGKPTLVPETDKRPAISNVPKAADVFRETEQTTI